MGNTGSRGAKDEQKYAMDVSILDSGNSVYITSPLYKPKSTSPIDVPESQKRFRSSTITGPSDFNAEKLPVVFHWRAPAANVCVSGSFNDWKTKIPLVKSQDNFVTIQELPEGQHQYKYFVDGNWLHDPSEPTIKNEFGTINNVINLKFKDFEVFEALAVDSASVAHSAGPMGSPKASVCPGTSPAGDYGQTVPSHEERSAGPPSLPPHLLQIMLNEETPLNNEPSLLREPNHVMLNHMYALSIKEGVMVLSATHRYGKKFVTTLLYKPIEE